MTETATPRLLIVEDEAIVVADVTIRLTHLGYEVVGTASSGEEAMELAVQLRPDLVLMDIHLQGLMDGIAAALELRTRCQIPVVFLTAYGEGAVFQRAKQAEPFGYILKPFEDRELRIVIEMALYKHRAERKLQDSELRHRSILETAMHGFWLADLDGQLLEVNQSYCRMTGYSAAELLGMNIADLEIDETAAQVRAHNQRIVELGEHRFESRHRRKDGSVFDVEVSCQYQPAQGGFMVTFLRDITALKQAQIYQEMGGEVLTILNEPGAIHPAIRRILTVIKLRTGVDAVAMRMQDGEDFPYFAQHGFSKEFLLAETSLIERGADGEICKDCHGQACLACTCGLVIGGKTQPSEPNFTRRGSFWTNDSLPLRDLPPELDPRYHPRNNCIDHGYASIALVPIRTKDQVVGLLQLNAHRNGCFTLQAVEILEEIATHIGEALLRKRAEDDLRQSKADLRVLATRLQAAREQERASLARELHDFFGQHLTALQIDLMWMDRHLQAAPPPDLSVFHDKLVAMVPVVERLTEQTQTLCAALRPSVLYDLGLAAAIEWQVEDTAKRCGLIGKLSLPTKALALDDDCALALYRIVQEALTNVVRHAQATQVDVMLHTDGDQVVLEIQDDGRGFAPESRPGSKSLGLLGMQERVAGFGGAVEFCNTSGTGACVRVRMPYGAKRRSPIPTS
ncbi:MAG: PAS domain S-box protein [Verrucomicrobiota bacterium]